MSITRVFVLTDDSETGLTGQITTFDEKGARVGSEPVDLAAFPGNIVAAFFGAPQVEDDTAPVLRGHLPDGFPDKSALEEAGHGTYAKVRALIAKGPDWFEGIAGIGKPTAEKIEAAV